MESEPIATNCTHSVIKIMGLSSILKRSFHLALFGSIVCCSFGKHWLLSSLDRSSNVNSFHFTRPKVPLFFILPLIIKKPESTRKLTKFSKFLTFTEKLACYYWQQILALVFHEMTGSLYLLLDNVCWTPNFNNSLVTRSIK